MTKTFFTIAAAALFTTGSALALDRPASCSYPNSTAQGQSQKRGKGPSADRGRKTGPQDGSGPIHTPGTGGGTGAGRRAGRK
jgi:hypothetical protein